MTATTSARPVAQAPRAARRLAWVTWRQQRSAYVGAAILLGVLAGVMVWTGISMRADYRRIGLSSCGALTGPRCQVPLRIFDGRHGAWGQFLPRYLAFLPGVLGVFVGAPLIARELETGSYRFAWTQGRTRTRWVVSKLLLVLLPVTVAALAFSILFTWWFEPFQPFMGRISAGQAYEVSGVVFASRTLFGIALGALVGTLLRRVVPAMAVAGVLWLAIVWPSTLWLRPLIEAPVSIPADASPVTANHWTISEWYVSSTGRHIDVKSSEVSALFQKAAADGAGGDDAFQAWLARHGYVLWASYQPGSRFWHFQLVEGGAYTAVAAALAGATVLRVRRRAD